MNYDFVEFQKGFLFEKIYKIFQYLRISPLGFEDDNFE